MDPCIGREQRQELASELTSLIQRHLLTVFLFSTVIL